MVAGAGIGLRPEHAWARGERPPNVEFLEAHLENFLNDGPALADLQRLRRDYALSLHSVALSITAADGPDDRLLAATARLVERLEPELFSVHCAWVGAGGANFLGLYPFPRTPAALEIAARGVDTIQCVLRRPILVENLAPMMDWRASEHSEPEFLNALARRTGCRLLLDVNNIAVGAANLGTDPKSFLADVAPDLVGQYHLAGHTETATPQGALRIDSHDCAVAEEVWGLFERAVARFGRHPCTIERDDADPPLQELLAEAERAAKIQQQAPADVA